MRSYEKLSGSGGPIPPSVHASMSSMDHIKMDGERADAGGVYTIE
jgi:hypothetical protein